MQIMLTVVVLLGVDGAEPALAGMSLYTKYHLRDVTVVTCRHADLTKMDAFALPPSVADPSGILLTNLPAGVILRMRVLRERFVSIESLTGAAFDVTRWAAVRAAQPIDVFYVTSALTCDWFRRHPRGIVESVDNFGCDTTPFTGLCALDPARVVTTLRNHLAAYAR